MSRNVPHYAYRANPARSVPGIVGRHAGPVRRAPGRPRRTLAVSLDGDGDFASVRAALGAVAAAGGRGPVTIEVAPGVYRELVHVWPTASGVTIRGVSGDPGDTVLTYDLGVEQEKFYGGAHGAEGSATLSVPADRVTLADLTVENTFAGEGPAVALHATGEGLRLRRVTLRPDR
ncbi:pectinesterase family protein [Streptomyces sp. SBT349]|uniref:pectinesterase family protein n=1 Tax=Streptomyces sp. SBT349 TaxID=1580539 RepID=UPI00066C13E6|nr:pectinesterase family protein [Streptomyces sp. SBT349]